ncbi:hypothetical protein BH23GEM10_BH23GEM10_13700 [soil metagenome]
MNRRNGFTLIELLIVIVIIGILAAIAIPKFGATRERAHVRAMISDLRNLSTQQELYFMTPTSDYTYATSLAALDDFSSTQGVTVQIIEASKQGWLATASHAALSLTHLCGLYFGTITAPPAFADVAGVVGCTED